MNRGFVWDYLEQHNNVDTNVIKMPLWETD